MRTKDRIYMAALVATEDLRRWAYEHATKPTSRSDSQDPREAEEGSTTVEYAIGAVAAAGFAGLLLVVLKSGAVRSALQGIIEKALTL